MYIWVLTEFEDKQVHIPVHSIQNQKCSAKKASVPINLKLMT